MDFSAIIKKIGVSLLIMIGTLLNSIFPGTSIKEITEIKSSPLKLTENFTITAHAGAMNLPDNSLEALSAAVIAGMDIVEIDLSFRPDGTPVMIHDSNPSGDKGILLDKAFAIVAKSDKTKMNLDCKSAKNLPGLYELLKKYSLTDRAFFTGVGEGMTDMLKAQCPVPYYLNYSIDKKNRDNRDFALELAQKMKAQDFIGLNCSFDEISRTFVEAMHENGLLVSVWTVNNTIDMYRMLALSVDNITTRNPLKLQAVINGWK